MAHMNQPTHANVYSLKSMNIRVNFKDTVSYQCILQTKPFPTRILQRHYDASQFLERTCLLGYLPIIFFFSND